MICIQNQVVSLEILPECAILNVSVHLAEENRRSQGQQSKLCEFFCASEDSEVILRNLIHFILKSVKSIASRQLFFTLQGESPFFDFTFLGGRLRRNVSSFFGK